MRIRNLVLVMIVLIAAGTLAMAAGTGNPDAGRPEDAGPDNPMIEIDNNTVVFNFFNLDNPDIWEIDVYWEEGTSGGGHTQYNESYNGTIEYNVNTGSRSYMVMFFTDKTEPIDRDESPNSEIIILPHYGQLVYDVEIETYTEDGEILILNMTGILDLTSLATE